jgi:GntR family transcriptional regulator
VEPRYRQIAEAMKKAILEGTYTPGSKLPTEQQLADAWGASRDTVRQAIARLRAEGWVETQRPGGTFVRPRRTVRRRWAPDFPRGGPYRDFQGARLENTEMRIVAVEVVAADAELAAWLEIPEGAEVTMRRREWVVDGDVLQLFDSYFPQDVVRGTALDGPTIVEHGSYWGLEAIGHRPARFTEEVTARPASAEEAAALRIGPGKPLLEIRRTTRDSEGRAVEGLRVRGGADRNVLVYEDIPIPPDVDLR